MVLSIKKNEERNLIPLRFRQLRQLCFGPSLEEREKIIIWEKSYRHKDNNHLTRMTITFGVTREGTYTQTNMHTCSVFR